MMKNQKGVSLIELIVFIIVLGILGTGFLMAFAVALEQIPHINKTERATELAQREMERLLGQKQPQGFDNISDPCDILPQPDICESVPQDYQIDPITITHPWDSNDDYKAITVTVKTANGSQVLSSLRSIVAKY